MNIDLAELGKKIKKLREEMGLTQTQIADYLAVDQSYISKFEKGERVMNADILSKLAALFCCPVPDLLSDDNTDPCCSISFRASSVKGEDLESLSMIHKIAMNQFWMDDLLGEDE